MSFTRYLNGYEWYTSVPNVIPLHISSGRALPVSRARTKAASRSFLLISSVRSEFAVKTMPERTEIISQALLLRTIFSLLKISIRMELCNSK